MRAKIFFTVTGIIFLLIFLLHLLRVINGWEAVIGGWIVPMWLSWAGVVIAAFLTYSALRLQKRS